MKIVDLCDEIYDFYFVNKTDKNCINKMIETIEE